MDRHPVISVQQRTPDNDFCHFSISNVRFAFWAFFENRKNSVSHRVKMMTRWPSDPVPCLVSVHHWLDDSVGELSWAELSFCRHDTTASLCCSDAGVVQCRGRISWLKQLISAVCWHITVARILHCCRVWSVSQCDLVVAVTYSTLISLKLIVSAAHCQNCDARCAGFICRTQRGLFFVAFSPLPHGGIKNFFVMHQMFQTADVWAACGQPLHTQPFNGPLSRTTRVSRYQKGKTNLDFTEGRQWVAVASAGPYASLHLAPDR